MVEVGAEGDGRGLDAHGEFEAAFHGAFEVFFGGELARLGRWR